MNVDIVGRIRPGTRPEGAETLVTEGHKVAAHPRGPYLNFQYLHRQDATNLDVFRTSVDNLLELHMAGFNVCLLVMGESEAGKTYSIAGEGQSKSGIVPMIFDALFTRLQGDRYMQDTRVKRQNPRVTLQMYEIYNELIKDLLQVPTAASSYLDLANTADKGTYVRNGTEISLKDSSEASAHFRSGLSRRTEAKTDYGPAQNNAATLIHVDLQMQVGDNPQPNRSRFTIVELPGLEKLSNDPSELRQREGPALSKALISLNQVVTSLASNPYPDRVVSYGDSKLTQLLKDQLGGNCKTRALLCLKPKTEPSSLSSILQFTTSIQQVKNFPIVNDSFAQNLITQYRAQIIDLQQQSGVGPAPMARVVNPGDVREQIRGLEMKNLDLRQENERLNNRISSMQNKFGSLANTKTDLSTQLLITEEDKLKISQSLVEMQIENNKIREEAEASRFELTNKILMLENELQELQTERDRAVRGARNAKDRLAEMEKDRKDLADEYVVLKTNYLALVREHEKETKRNEDLSIELLNLVNAKAALMRQINAMADGGAPGGDPQAEIDRVKALVLQNSSGKVKSEEILGTQQDRESVEKALFASRRKYETEMDRIRRELGEDKDKLENRTQSLMKELNDARNLARERQQKLAEMNAALIMARSDKENLEMQVNRLQHKVKDLGEDYRIRLIKYVDDISEYVDKGSGVPDAKRENKLKSYVDSMLKDITLAHKEREEQLSLAAQQYREAKRNMAHKYQELLVHYRNLRLSAEARGFDPADLGPDEQYLKLSDQEINSSHLKEITRLKTELTAARADIDSLKVKFGVPDDAYKYLKPGEKGPETWAALRKQLREFQLNTQKQLEDERTRLLTENEVLKEQLRESQNYIESHLVRYKQEIVKLRKLCGYEEDQLYVGFTDRKTPRGKGRKY